jgi:copper chaperone CopZ
MFIRWNSLYGNLAMIAVACAGMSLSGCNHPVGNAKDTPSKATATKVTRQFEVEGMHCDGCAESIASALKAVPGIKSATVSFEFKKAMVVTEGEQPATSEIEKTISGLGFKPRLLAPSKEASATSKPLRSGEPGGAAK